MSEGLKLEQREDDLPPGWDRVAIEEICTLGGGKTPRKSNGEYWGGNIPWVSPKDFDGVTLNETEDHLTEFGVSDNSINLYEAGDIAMVVRSGVLRHSLPVAQLSSEMAVNQDIKVLQPDTTKVTTDYLLNILLYESDRIRASCAKTGTTVESIETAFLKAYKLPLPPLPEQRRIADILSTVDEQIQQTDEMIENLESVRRGTVQHFFHNHEGRDTITQRLGPLDIEIPSDWSVATIDSICKERQLGTDDRSEPKENGVPLIKMGNLVIGSWDFEEVERIYHDDDLVEKYALEQGDLLFNTRNSPELVGKTAVWDSKATAVYDNNLLRLRFTDDIEDPRYVNLFLSSGVGRRYIKSFVHGTTSVAAIYWKDLATLRLPIPSPEEQWAILDSINTIDSRLDVEKETRRNLKELKRGLMQDLLTGTVRVDPD